MVAAPFDQQLVETRSLKEADVMRGFACEGKIGQDFADDGAELKGVSGTATCKYNV